MRIYRVLLYRVLLFLTFSSSGSYHALGYAIDDKIDAIEFLSRFGYIDKKGGGTTGQPVDLTDLRKPLEEFQILSGIKPTGLLDEETIKVMNAPRCGNPDKYPGRYPGSGRLRRYALFPDNRKWRKREVTYRTTRLTQKLDESSAHRDIDLAFKLWESAANINFVKVAEPNQEVDIDLSFVELDHLDNNPFDGPGRSLAHAFAPGQAPISGDVHFDDSESWTVETNKGTNLYFVAVHEIGHAIGLTHSRVKGAIMEARYPGYIPNLRLHPDDIAGVQELYGTRMKVSSTPGPRLGSGPVLIPTVCKSCPGTTSTAKPRNITPKYQTQLPTTTTPRPTLPTNAQQQAIDLCKDPQMDAITTLQNGKIYVFKGDFVYHLDPHGRGVLSTQKIQTVFPGLHSGIDAALTREDGDTLFFKGDKYWKYRNYQEQPGYPMEIARHFPGIPNGIDAAFEWPGDGRLYFFKGGNIWPFSPDQKSGAKSPKWKNQSMQLFRIGIFFTDSIDSAFVAPNKRVFLFSKKKYWRLDALDKDRFYKSLTVPSYPRNAPAAWFNCSNY